MGGARSIKVKDGTSSAGSAVSVDQRVAFSDLCRSGFRPATLLLSMLLSLSQQLPA